MPARSRWFNQLFTTRRWTEEGSAVWPKQQQSPDCFGRKFLLMFDFSVSCFSRWISAPQVLCWGGNLRHRRWAQVGPESLEWRSLLRYRWDPFIVLPPGRSKYCSAITCRKSPSRCHGDKTRCSGYTVLLLALAVTTASTNNVCSLLASGIVLERPFPGFQRTGSVVSPPLPLPSCFLSPFVLPLS